MSRELIADQPHEMGHSPRAKGNQFQRRESPQRTKTVAAKRGAPTASAAHTQQTLAPQRENTCTETKKLTSEMARTEELSSRPAKNRRKAYSLKRDPKQDKPSRTMPKRRQTTPSRGWFCKNPNDLSRVL